MKLKLPSQTFLFGLILLTISLIIFIFSNQIETRDNMGVFFIHLAMSYIYLTVCLVHRYQQKRHKKPNSNRGNFSLFGILFLLAAFSLNNEMTVFQTLVPWLKISLIVSCVNLISLSFHKKLPQIIKIIQMSILGFGLIIFFYFAVYVIPITPIALCFFWFFGIPLVALAPLTLVICSLSYVFSITKNQPTLKLPIHIGWIAPLVFLIFFSFKIYQGQCQINYTLNDQEIEGKSTLPKWVAIAQKVPSNYFTNLIIQSNLTHATDFWSDWGFDAANRMNFENVQYHDPILVISTQFMAQLPLDKEERARILETNMDIRHYTEERLWRGTDLETINVTSNIRLYPSYRMAYTEKTLTIVNNSGSSRPQEALYTFHLPEGSAVSSLSLWINGKEEKGYLTSKGKANKAYKTIVGVENRDPSLVHWKEGNRVTVRVFPCNFEEPRKVKIGFTSPLTFEDKRLIYSNIFFEGPTTKRASESIYLNQIEPLEELSIPFQLRGHKPNIQVHRGTYQAQWKMSVKAPSLSKAGFTYQGKSYYVSPSSAQSASIQWQNIYLDITKDWGKSEFKEIWKQVRDKKVFVANGDRFTQVNKENAEDLFETLNQQNFSLLPFFSIQNPNQSLIITKGSKNSPRLAEIKDSEFAKRIIDYMVSDAPKAKMFNFGKQFSPYQKSMLELRLLTVDQGSMKDLKQILEKNEFLLNQENEHQVVIPSAHIMLHQTSDSAAAASHAPDHLFRLYTYNQLMRNLGADYFNDTIYRKEVVQMAQMANVVSPVSSLIVLETQMDYDRFEIKKEENALANASMHNSGSVPEPHEWLLIILGIILISFPYLRTKFFS